MLNFQNISGSDFILLLGFVFLVISSLANRSFLKDIFYTVIFLIFIFIYSYIVIYIVDYFLLDKSLLDNIFVFIIFAFIPAVLTVSYIYRSRSK